MRVRYAVRLMQRIPALTVREIEAASGASKILIAPASVTMIGQARLSFVNQRYFFEGLDERYNYPCLKHTKDMALHALVRGGAIAIRLIVVKPKCLAGWK